MNINEHQETIDKLRGIVSEKIDDISNIQMKWENINTALKAQIQEL
jgi:centromeric protein E